MDLVARVDDRVAATETPGPSGDNNQLDVSGHPWDRWDDGRLWRGIYYVRSTMLAGFAAASWASGAHAVAYTVIALVLPFDILVAARHTADRRYEALLDGINALVYETDLHSGEILYMNRRTRQLIGSAARSDDALLALVHPDDRHLAVEAARRARATGRSVTTELRILSPTDGCYGEMHTTVSTKGARRRARTVLIDVSDRKRAELELAHRAVHDPLTDLPNRALLGERLALALSRASDVPCPNALLLLDLNNFKRVNDALGHASGDLLLIELANRLRHIADSDDTVARLGGDEFAVLMPSADHIHAREFAHRCSIVLSAPWKDRGVTVNPTVSIGIAVAQGPATDADAETLLCQADAAMYECKRTGADHVVYDVTLERLNVERLRLLSGDLEGGALRRRLSDLRGGEVVEEAE